MNQFAEALAVIVWGVVACVLLFVLAVNVGSFWGAALSVVAALATYVFQATLYSLCENDRGCATRSLRIMQTAPVVIGIAAFICTCFGV